VSYESRITWKAVTDYLRCSPRFFDAPRYDYALINTAQGVLFAQLVFVFSIQLSETIYPMALIQGFTPATRLQKDKDLRFLRLKKLKKTELIFARSIIRGAVLLPAGDTDGDYIVYDLTDQDMCMRIQKILLS
jgi:hypothetical protein